MTARKQLHITSVLLSLLIGVGQSYNSPKANELSQIIARRIKLSTCHLRCSIRKDVDVRFPQAEGTMRVVEAWLSPDALRIDVVSTNSKGEDKRYVSVDKEGESIRLDPIVGLVSLRTPQNDYPFAIKPRLYGIVAKDPALGYSRSSAQTYLESLTRLQFVESSNHQDSEQNKIYSASPTSHSLCSYWISDGEITRVEETVAGWKWKLENEYSSAVSGNTGFPSKSILTQYDQIGDISSKMTFELMEIELNEDISPTIFEVSSLGLEVGEKVVSHQAIGTWDGLKVHSSTPPLVKATPSNFRFYWIVGNVVIALVIFWLWVYLRIRSRTVSKLERDK